MLLVVLFASMFAFWVLPNLVVASSNLVRTVLCCSANRFLPLQVARNDDGESADGLVHHGEAV